MSKLTDRIDELERRIRELETRPIYVPQPYVVAYFPFPPLPTPIWQVPYVTTTFGTGAGLQGNLC